MIVISPDKKSTEATASPASDCASVAAASVTAPPPAYTQDDGRAPSYPPDSESEDTEEEKGPYTILRPLFWIGFLLPCLWIWGTFVFFTLWSRSPAIRVKLDVEGQQVIITKSEVRRLRRRHATELKWARRCAFAFLGILVLLAIVMVSVFVGLSSGGVQ